MEKHFSPKKWMCAKCMCKWPTHEQYTPNLQNDQNTPRTTKMIKYSWDNKNDQMIYVILFSHESSMLFWDVITYYRYLCYEFKPNMLFYFFKFSQRILQNPRYLIYFTSKNGMKSCLLDMLDALLRWHGLLWSLFPRRSTMVGWGGCLIPSHLAT